MKATADFYLDTLRPKQDGSCNVKIRIYFNRKYRYYSTDIDLTEPDFKTVMFAKRRTDEQKTTHTKMNVYLTKATSIIDKMSIFSFDIFEEAYFEKRNIINSVSYSFDKKIKELREADQYNTATTYECAKKSLEAFKKNLTFADITVSFLNRYQRYMEQQGKSITTIGIYLRNLRTLYNNQNIQDRSIYPFGSGSKKYEIPTGRNIKKALTFEEITAIYNYECSTRAEAQARDYWIFMFQCNGMNVKDLCLLRWKNIHSDKLTYQRAKTRRTKKDQKDIQVSLKSETLDIINRHGMKSINKDNFIFDILSDSMNAETQNNTVKQLTYTINKYMKRIALAVGIDADVTTYFARHSFATILKRTGTDVSMISDLMGHSNVAVTEKYLSGFEDEALKAKTDVLSGFNKKIN